MRMPEIRIYDPPERDAPTFRPQGLVQAATDVTLVDRFWSPGYFTISVPNDARHADRLTVGRLVLVDGSFWGILDDLSLELTTSGHVRTVSGRQLKGLTADRITIPPSATEITGSQGYDAVTGRTEAIMKHFVTANLADPQLPSRQIWGLVVADDLGRGLVEAGMNPDMPAAVLHRGTTAYQKRVVATVSTLPEAAAKMEAPSIIVVGKVCALAEEFAWAEERPLFGKRFLVTRPRERASELTRRLRELGAEVVELPTIETKPLLQAELTGLEDSRWLTFTSPSAVTAFFRVLKAQRRDVRSLASLRIGALGPGTAKELEKVGILPDLVPETYDARGFAKALTPQLHPGDKVFLPCAAGETPALKTLLADLDGVTVTAVPVYEKNCVVPPILKPMELLDDHTWAIFASGSAVRGFAAAAGQEDLSQVRALCIGEQTRAQAEQYHMQTKTAKVSTLDGLVTLALDCDKEETEWK